jgi:putative ABC transport system substrate-binding protein
MTVLSRRAFIGSLVGLGASTAGLALGNGCGLLPFAARPRVARVGLLWSGSPLSARVQVAMRDGLRDAGWVDGQNLVIEERTFGGDHFERIPDLAAELVALKPDVLLAGATIVAQAFVRATDSIPIVVAGVSDPVGSGLIASYARPGANVTGTSRTGATAKLLDLLRQLVPGLARVVAVFESDNAGFVYDVHAIQAAAQSIGIDAQTAVGFTSADDLEGALEAVLAGHPQALIMEVGSGRIIQRTNELALPAITRFALQHGLPAASEYRVATTVGGLLTYGPDEVSYYRRAANYHVDRILRGSKPADLPFEGPTVFELTVNRQTARALGIATPPEFAAQVTEWVS